MNEVTRFFDAKNALGEGPLLDRARNTLWWVDITRGELHGLDLGTRAHSVVAMGGRTTCVALAGDALLVGVELSLAFFDPKTGAKRDHLRVFDPHSQRFNDGQVDPGGRLWVGTMSKDAKGHLYRLDARGMRVMRSGIGVSNGIGWSPDRKTMYYTDSPAHTIHAFDYDAATGELANERLFTRVDEPGGGAPDGLAVDADGFVWSARWDGWKIVRYDPDGRIERELRVPVQRPTSCAFIGESLDTLVITSARDGIAEAALDEQPLAGDLLAVRVDGARGMLPNVFDASR